MRLTIDTETDTYEQAIAAVQAAFELRPGVPVAWPDAPAAEPRPGPQDLADDNLAHGWTDQLLFHMIASLAPGARRSCAGSPSWAAPPPTRMCSTTSPTTRRTRSRRRRSAEL